MIENMGAPGGVEPPTNGLGNRCSIQLSYGATLTKTIHSQRLSYLRKPWQWNHRTFLEHLLGSRLKGDADGVSAWFDLPSPRHMVFEVSHNWSWRTERVFVFTRHSPFARMRNTPAMRRRTKARSSRVQPRSSFMTSSCRRSMLPRSNGIPLKTC
jgi:hypothetical protein